MRSDRCVALASMLALAVLDGTVAGAAPPSRSPGVALLLSVMVPGAGQLYNGDTRGYLYLGVEAGAWFARESYRDAGNQKEGEYERYARAHWSYDVYHNAAGGDGCDWTQRADSLILWFEQNDIQQYYEELGKLDAYRCGWDDFRDAYDPDQPDLLSPHRAEYRAIRKKSNDYLKKSELALSVAVLNRIVSGVDAFQTARRRRKQEAAETARFGPGGSHAAQTVHAAQAVHAASAAAAEPLFRLESRLAGTWDEPRAELRLVRSLP